MAGEDAQWAGFDGLHRAKQWLEASTRVAYSWTIRDSGMRELLEFEWPHGGKFSFDLGGKLRGEDLHDQMFLAEIKNYKKEGDLPTHFLAFLAKSYLALITKPQRCDHFMWISWAPFQAQKWDQHATKDNVRKAVTAHGAKIFGTTDPVAITAAIDEAMLIGVEERLWMLTLSARQEKLVIGQEYYGEVHKMMLQGDS